MQIRVTFDDLADAEMIDEIVRRSNGGPLSKALYRIVHEWYVLQKYQTGSDHAHFRADLDPDQGQTSLTAAAARLEADW